MKMRIDALSKKENFSESRLPHFTADQIDFIRGTFDFLGLNHYNTYLVSSEELPVGNPPSYLKDKGTRLVKDPHWKPSPQIVPWGFRKLFNWIKKQYGNPPIIVTENGYPDRGGLQDRDRVVFLKVGRPSRDWRIPIYYFQEYMKALILSIQEDGCNITGYTVWSILDNMEWRSGYTYKSSL